MKLDHSITLDRSDVMEIYTNRYMGDYLRNLQLKQDKSEIVARIEDQYSDTSEVYDPTDPQRSSHQGWSSEASLPLGGYINPSSNGSGPVELEDNETFGSIIKPGKGDNV